MVGDSSTLLLLEVGEFTLIARAIYHLLWSYSIQRNYLQGMKSVVLYFYIMYSYSALTAHFLSLTPSMQNTILLYIV